MNHILHAEAVCAKKSVEFQVPSDTLKLSKTQKSTLIQDKTLTGTFKIMSDTREEDGHADDRDFHTQPSQISCSTTILQPGENQWPQKQWLTALGVASLMLSTSLDTVWFDGSTKRRSNTLVVIVGAFIGAILADVIGRKRTLVMSLIFVIPRVASISRENEENSTWITELFLDIGAGVTCTVVPIYISEIAGAHIRGKLMVLQLLALICGNSIVQIETFFLNHYSELPKLSKVIEMAILIVSTMIHAITLKLCPETPEYLYSNKRYDESAKSLAFFERNDKFESEEETAYVSLNSQMTGAGYNMWWEKFIKTINLSKNRKSLALIFSFILIKWVSGKNSIDLALTLESYVFAVTDLIAFPILITAVKIIVIIVMVFYIRLFVRRIYLSCMIAASFLSAITMATNVGTTNSWIRIVFPLQQHLGHLILTGVALAHTGEFFSIDVRAIAIATVISLETMTRFVILAFEQALQKAVRSSDLFLISVCGLHAAALFFAFIYVMCFSPKTDKVLSDRTATVLATEGE